MNKLNLTNVTLVGIDGYIPTRLIRPIRICTNYCNFYDVVMVQDKDINTAEKYSYFVMKQLNDYIKSEFCLIIQYDGYILNPNMWTNEFFNYDYIGAVWKYGPESLVGNGGFSLRSKKLLKILQREEVKFNHPEDHYICRKGCNYEYLVSQGIKFAPVELANKFSIEGGIWSGNSLGFHNDRITNISKWAENDYILQNI